MLERSHLTLKTYVSPKATVTTRIYGSATVQGLHGSGRCGVPRPAVFQERALVSGREERLVGGGLSVN